MPGLNALISTIEKDERVPPEVSSGLVASGALEAFAHKAVNGSGISRFDLMDGAARLDKDQLGDLMLWLPGQVEQILFQASLNSDTTRIKAAVDELVWQFVQGELGENA